jgi:hypothetical protein
LSTTAKKKRSRKTRKSRRSPPPEPSSSSDTSDDIDFPQLIGILIALVGVSIILGAISDIEKAHPWWLFWVPGIDVIGIVAGLYLVFAGLVVLIVPEDQRGDAVKSLLRALEVTLKTIVLLSKSTAHHISEWDKRRKAKKQESHSAPPSEPRQASS